MNDKFAEIHDMLIDHMNEDAAGKILAAIKKIYGD